MQRTVLPMPKTIDRSDINKATMSKKIPAPPSDMERLQTAIFMKNVKEALSVLRSNRDQTILRSDVSNYRCHSEGNVSTETDDTILHLAAAVLDERHSSIIEGIVNLSPELLASGKTSSHYKGQTPLHILIVRKQNDVLRRIKDLLLIGDLQIGETVRNNIANPNVTGEKFRKTIMEGELPHIVAALTLDIQTAKIVIQMTRKNIKAQNSKGNTVYHCLVEHAARYPEKMQEITAMWNFLGSCVGDNQTGGDDEGMQAALGSKYALRQINKDRMRPLQLAAKLGVSYFFNTILDSEKIQNVEERLFDTYLYDISVIDTLAHYEVEREMEKKHREQTTAKKSNQIEPSQTVADDEDVGDLSVSKAVEIETFKYSQSILEMTRNRRFAENKISAFEMIRQPPMKMLIDLKWKGCRCLFLTWAIVHTLIMVLYSGFAVQWAVVAFPSNSTHPTTTESQKTFVFAISILYFIIGLIYIVITILLLTARCIRPNLKEYITHDLEYIVLLFLFSTSVLGNSIWHLISLEHGVYFLLTSLLCGWWFTIFFLRAFEPISFYVAMIQKVIFGDLLRFGLFIILSLISFSIAFQVLFQGNGVPTAYGDEDMAEPADVFFRTCLINIRLMFGLGDIDILHDAREPAIAYIVYIVFVIMTYLVLLNSLIAMISETCTSVRKNERVFYHTQRLYVILFLEEISYPLWSRFKKSMPKQSYEERDVKTRNGNILYRSYFIKMTEEAVAKGTNNDKHQENTYQQLQPRTEILTLNIQQPFLEESIGEDNELTYEMKWKDEKL